MRPIAFLKFFLFVIIFGACEKENAVKTDTELISDLREKAQSVITIGSQQYFLDAYLWRDFMPISPPDGKPLLSINSLISKDSLEIPSNIDLVKQYVIYGDSIWIANYEDEDLPEVAYKIEKISREGPKWGPGVSVDVIAEVVDRNTGRSYFVKMTNVLIVRTD